MNKIQSTVMNLLLDKYEESKTFQGTNQRNQQFTVAIDQKFPRYKDDADYEYYIEVNESLYELEEKEFIKIKEKGNGTIDKAILNLDSLEKCYQYLSRQSKVETNIWLLDIWEKNKSDNVVLAPVNEYIKAQKKKMQKNNKIEFLDGNQQNYLDLLTAVNAVLLNEEEIFMRDFSISVFRDSKRVEQLQSKIESFLYSYGDFEEKDSVLEECGVVKMPTYVAIKGNAVMHIHEQVLDLSYMDGDIALSTISLRELKSIEVLGNRVVTIENLTSFHAYSAKEDCVIYLGGFHNKTKRNFIRFIYAQNPQAEYCHFGDIDAGGFYILEHLKNKTGIAFHSLYMDKETLLAYIDDTKPLTKNDRIRLRKLRDDLEDKKKKEELSEDYLDVIDCMLEKGCKLEQEAVRVRK